MDKSSIIENAYKTIKSNIDWGIECDSKVFGYFIDGVISMTETLLEELKEEVCEADWE